MRIHVSIGSALLSALLCAACQTYNTIALPDVRPGNDVRLTLSADGMAQVVPIVGPRVSALEGHLLSVDTSSVKMTVHNIVHPDGSFTPYHDEMVVVPRGAVATTEIKRLSKGRTVLLTGAFIAGAAAAATIGSGESEPGKSTGGSSTTPR